MPFEICEFPGLGGASCGVLVTRAIQLGTILEPTLQPLMFGNSHVGVAKCNNRVKVQ